MARIFVPTAEGGWDAKPLEIGSVRLRRAPGDPAAGEPVAPDLVSDEACDPAPEEALLLRVAEMEDGEGSRRADPEPRWAVLAGPQARLQLNGEAVAIGIALLRHRDELRLEGGAPLYLSTERLAAVEACTRSDAPRCPRCAQAIAQGEPCVRCPGCGVLHHELPDRPCWTHLPSCALCDQPTDLDAGLRWSPEEL